MTPARFGNLIVALVLGVLVACVCNLVGGCQVDDSGLIDSPDGVCATGPLESCLARVAASDAGTD